MEKVAFSSRNVQEARDSHSVFCLFEPAAVVTVALAVVAMVEVREGERGRERER